MVSLSHSNPAAASSTQRDNLACWDLESGPIQLSGLGTGGYAPSLTPFVTKCLRAATKVLVKGDIPAPSGFMTPATKGSEQFSSVAFPFLRIWPAQASVLQEPQSP